jgi:hypothetical protein
MMLHVPGLQCFSQNNWHIPSFFCGDWRGQERLPAQEAELPFLDFSEVACDPLQWPIPYLYSDILFDVAIYSICFFLTSGIIWHSWLTFYLAFYLAFNLTFLSEIFWHSGWHFIGKKAAGEVFSTPCQWWFSVVGWNLVRLPASVRICMLLYDVVACNL